MAGSVALLCATPVAVEAWPVDDPEIDPERLRDLVRASSDRPYQGYAESVGVLGLPALPRLARVTELLSGNTRLRAWYGGRERWRVDVVGTGQERGTYRTPAGVVTWDYGANQLVNAPITDIGSVVSAGGHGLEFRDLLGESPGRLPRGADLLPPDLARRVLDLATGDPVGRLPARRVAGVTAAGMRITSADPHTTVGHIDIWADPVTGLPLQVAVTARNAERPVLVTRFLDVAATAPAAGVLTPPGPGPDTSIAEPVDNQEFSLFDDATGGLPDRIAGLARGDAGNRFVPPEPGRTVRVHTGVGATYGTGLARVLVLRLNRRIAGDVRRGARGWGQEVTIADGEARLIAAPLLSVMLVHRHSLNASFLVAGLVDGVLLQRFGTELAGQVTGGRRVR